MASARCPVCEDIITLGISPKLNQPVTCPTCLANLQVVSLNPFELELPTRKRNGMRRNGQPANLKRVKSQKSGRVVQPYNDLGEDDDYDDYDDYVLERRQRHKGERDKRRRGG